MKHEAHDDLNDLADLASLGSLLAKLGTQLRAFRLERAEIDAKIVEVEKEIGPLLARYGQIIASITGAAIPTPKPEASRNTSTDVSDVFKARIFDYIKTKAVDGMSASDIADVLKVDAEIVRECMRDLMNSRGPE